MVFLQTIVVLLLICFLLMASVVAYYTFFADADAERKKGEIDRLIAEVGAKQSHGKHEKT